MFGNAFGWPHLLIILAVLILLFGAAKLPALAKSIGQSARVFKGEMKAMKQEEGVSSESTAESSSAEQSTVKDPGSEPGTPPRA